MAAGAKQRRKYDTDPDVITARGRLAEALQHFKADEAADAARALVEAKKRASVRRAKDVLTRFGDVS